MTDGNTCTCRGYTAMHKPHPHADRDGSEARAQLEREHERALAAYVPEDQPAEVERLRAEVADLRAAVVEMAPKDEVLVEGSYFARADLPRILGNYVRSAGEAWQDVKALAEQVADTRRRAEKAEAALARVKRALDDELANLADDGARLSHSVVRRIEAAIAEREAAQ